MGCLFGYNLKNSFAFLSNSFVDCLVNLTK